MSDWSTFFLSIRKYLEYFRSCDHIPAMRGFPVVSTSQIISEYELTGLLSWTELATAIAHHDPEARRHMYEDRQWNCVENVIGLLTCSIPLVLKGKLYKFLAALAVDETAAVHIWNCLLSEGICLQMENGKLSGIQQDLEEQECVLKIYDCSQGYLILMKALFRHKTRPAAKQIAPHLQFIVKSIICQFLSRSYNDSDQMWELVKVAIDCLYELLKMFYVTQFAISNNSAEVQLLTQLLNDTPLLRNVLNVIAEGVNDAKETYPRNTPRDEAAFSAIRLLYTVISYRSSMADAIRAVASNIIICTVEALMFSPIPAKREMNCLALLLIYVSEQNHFIRHTFYVVKILRELCCQRPSLQRQIVQSVYSCPKSLVDAFAQLTSVDLHSIEILQSDAVLSDVEDVSPPRVRGEIVRHLLETFIDAIDSDPKSNVAYLLLGFNTKDLENAHASITNKNSGSTTCLRNILDFAQKLVTLSQPFSVKFSGILEPSLRVLLKLASFRSATSSTILRVMRSHDNLIFKLATSSVFKRVDSAVSMEKLCSDNDVEISTIILRKSIQSVTLELIALELSFLLRMGLLDDPRKYIHALLATPAEYDDHDENNDADSTFATTVQPESEKVVLWSLLDQSRVAFGDFEVPICNKFDSRKVDELLRFCVRKNSCNIEQFDIEYLHILLNTEISSIMNAEIGLIREEAHSILEFCTQHNAKNLLEGACLHLLSGWLSVVNVLALHAPLSFVDYDVQVRFLNDALFLLKQYCLCVDASPEITSMLSNCMFRLVRAICLFFDNAQTTKAVLRQNLFPIVYILLECLLLPRYSKCVHFKMDMYGSILCIFDVCGRVSAMAEACSGEGKGIVIRENSNKSTSIPSTPKSLLSKTTRDFTFSTTSKLSDLMDEERHKADDWSAFFEPFMSEIVNTISSDITYAPLSLKIAATACLSNIIREDIVHSRNVAYHFVYSGSMACVLDTLSRTVMEFREERAKIDAKKCHKQMLLIKALLSLIIRLAASEHGWIALMNGKVLKRLILQDKPSTTDGRKPAMNNGQLMFRQIVDVMEKFKES